jgi:hypothetical protein
MLSGRELGCPVDIFKRIVNTKLQLMYHPYANERILECHIHSRYHILEHCKIQICSPLEINMGGGEGKCLAECGNHVKLGTNERTGND